MKIGILTLPLHSNYGGVLQAYALYTTLQKMGHTVTLIDDKVYSIDTLKEKLSLLRWNIFRLIGLRTGPHPQLCTKDAMTNILPFIYKHLPNQINMARINERTFDGIIVGSDQVWRGLYCSDLMRYFLNFTHGWNIHRWAYAASFGIDKWTQPENTLKECRELLQDFEYVSTREKSGIHICRELLGRADADWVIDPTMLLTRENYLSLCSNVSTCSKSKILYYILDENKETQSLLSTISKHKNMETVNVNNFIDGKHRNSIEYWLKSITDSNCVFTDSFHGVVFSILFNKPFIVYGNRERGLSRFETLLSMTGLSDRSVTSVEQIDAVLNNEINWNEVNERINRQRIRCLKIISTLVQS